MSDRFPSTFYGQKIHPKWPSFFWEMETPNRKKWRFSPWPTWFLQNKKTVFSSSAGFSSKKLQLEFLSRPLLGVDFMAPKNKCNTSSKKKQSMEAHVSVQYAQLVHISLFCMILLVLASSSSKQSNQAPSISKRSLFIEGTPLQSNPFGSNGGCLWGIF